MKAVCLLSGGMDSYVSAAIAKSKGYEIYAMSFNYGQRHCKEIDAAKKIAKELGVKDHIIIDVNLQNVFKSALTYSGDIPENRASNDEIPATYVPARNTLFLSFALGYAESLGASDIFIGVSQVDYSGYPDCRQEFIDAFENMANLATKAGVSGNRYKIQTPLINMSKTEDILLGLDLGVDFSLSTTCYNGREKACGKCDSCKLRLAAFKEAGMTDPIEYE